MSDTPLEEAIKGRLVPVDMGLVTDDPFWVTRKFPPDVKAKLAMARRLWSEATDLALDIAKERGE